MFLSDTESLYNFVMEGKKKGIPIRVTLKKKGVSTNQFYFKCKKLNLKKWSDQNADYIKTNNLNDNLSGGSRTHNIDRETEHNEIMTRAIKMLSKDISADDKQSD